MMPYMRHKKRTRKRKNKSTKKEEENADIFSSNFDPPKFNDVGYLGTDNNRYHQTVIIENELIKLNDSVLVLTEEEKKIRKDFTWVGQISKLYETPNKEMHAEVQWYFQKNEIPEHLREFVLNREILLSEHHDDIPIDSIYKKAVVYSDPAPLGENANKPLEGLVTDFFCNRGYINARAEFVALSTLHRLLKLSDMQVEAVEGTSNFDKARAMLQLSNTRDVFGRENELRALQEAIGGLLMKKGNGGCLYVSGVPGTGKTLCVREVMRRLSQKSLEGEVVPHEYVEVNCLALDDLRHVYVELWRALSGERLGPYTAKRALHEVFSLDPPTDYIVVLLDEIDVLLTRGQDELYCLLEWSSLPQSHLVVVAVANLMDLDARLRPKLASRFGRLSVKFIPYRAEDIASILAGRVGPLGVFGPESLEYCSRKTANVGGDARKALDACRRALELAGGERRVSLKDMDAALKAQMASRCVSILDSLSAQQKVVLAAVLNEARLTNRTVMPLRDILRRHARLQRQAAPTAEISTREASVIVAQLADLKILKVSVRGRPGLSTATVCLQVMEHDVLISMNKDEKARKLLPK